MSDIGLIRGPEDGPDADREPRHDDDEAPRRRNGGRESRPDPDDDREPHHDDPGPRRSGGHRHSRRRRRSWIPALVLLVIAAVIVAGGSYGYHRLKADFASAPDYPGPGHGQVLFQVRSGDTVAAMGNGMHQKGVVKSVGSFLDAARKDSRSSSIQVGFYQLKLGMKSSDALAVLVDPKNLIQAAVTVPEGSRVSNVVDRIVKSTDLKRKDLELALRQPQKLGLPAAAGGNPEGYLFPATYTVLPKETALQLLQQMVAKSVAVQKDDDIATAARKQGLTPQQVLTMASILEFEASRDEDYPKVARAIYNRLHKGMPLQSDATVAFANNTKGTVYTTAQERAVDSPYNTYRHAGLPPGPIGSPGEKTIKAVLHPADGNQLYWVVVNLATGETRYADTYAGHLKNVALFRTYCKTSDAC